MSTAQSNYDDSNLDNVSGFSGNNDNKSSISISNSQIDEDADKLEISVEFQENVIKYVKIDDLIKKKNREIRELKKNKKTCEDYIIKYLDEIDESIIDISNGKLKKNEYKTKKPLNKQIIQKTLLDEFKDADTVNKLLDMMNKNRPVTVKVSLKRTNNRKKNVADLLK